MNKKLIVYIQGWVLLIEGAAMQLSTVVGLIHREWEFAKYFLFIGLILIALGVVLVIKKPKSNVMYLKDGFACTALSWVVLSVAGCLPLWISRTIPHFIDAVFETVSGFTTTGATILTEIEHLPRCMLFWRSFSHFLGGMGVVVFLLAIIPRLGGNQSINLMKAESTGPAVSKSMPKLRNYAALLYGIYGGLTLLECILLLCGGMNMFDAVTTSFSTAGTGGFMVYNDSMARFSPYLQTVVAVFMMLFGVNFYIYIVLLMRRFKLAVKNEELWVYLGVTVGATVNVMLAAVKARGLTVIENAAKEPHIVDLANFLNSMGADVRGAGTDVIKIRGVDHMHGCDYSVIPDQIEAGTYMAAVAACGGDVLVRNVVPKHLESIIAKLVEAGVRVEEHDDAVRVIADKPLTKVNIKTMPHPGFPTDMQPQMAAALCLANGTSIVSEGVWDSRFKYVDQLTRMGAHIEVNGKVAIIQGVDHLNGCPVKAYDLRAGAAMIIAGLAAKGHTEIENIIFIDRGYENVVEKFSALGADISREPILDHPDKIQNAG